MLYDQGSAVDAGEVRETYGFYEPDFLSVLEEF